MLPVWEWVLATEFQTTLRAGFRKFPHSYFRVGTPTFFVSRVFTCLDAILFSKVAHTLFQHISEKRKPLSLLQSGL